MKKILFLLLLVIPSVIFCQDKVKFTAAGVTCSLCSNAIHNNLSKDKTLKKIEPNLETQDWFLTYEKNTFDLEKLKKQIEDAGFSLSEVWLNDKIVYERNKKKKNGNQKK
jgi:Cu+-exporting ATPase